MRLSGAVEKDRHRHILGDARMANTIHSGITPKSSAVSRCVANALHLNSPHSVFPTFSMTESAAPTTKKTDYNADDLSSLKGLEAVRKKPGMYIGGTDERALHHCVSEVLDNSVDEFLAGYCTHIDVTIHSDGSISIRDNGRGIPVDINTEEGMPGVELVLTRLHSGGKYGQGHYEYSGGTHGVGAKCVNAVSEWFKVEVTRDEKIHAMSFERGVTKQKLHVIADGKHNRHTGPLITFMPDPEIFQETTEHKSERIIARLNDLA